MADIAAGDITYTLQQTSNGLGRPQSGSYKNYKFLVEFGNGTLTYPSGGVPLAKASLGCPNALIEAHMIEGESADGFVYKYDNDNNKIRIYTADYDATADGALIELTAGTSAVAAADLYFSVVGW
jgi:hypothetical protein